jgi:hypothetical protein
MRMFRRFGDHTRWQPAVFRVSVVLIATIVCATLVARSTTSAHSTSQNTLAANQSFAVVLPVMVRLESGQLFQAPASVLDTTETPTSTATATAIPTSTPTITASATPTNSPECELQIEQNLQARLPAPNTGQVTNSSASCTYAVGLASYRMFDNNLAHQQLFVSQTGLLGPGETRAFTVELPGCAYQLDLFYGLLIETFDPQHGQIYGDRILITRVVRGAGFCLPGTTTPTAIATPSIPPIGSPTSTPTSSPTSTPTATDTPTSDTPTPTQGGT